jgi:peptide chain release factor subunit 1
MIDYKFVRELSASKANSSGTSLVTLYIPGGSALSLVTDKITSELSTAPNIKSKAVRKDVISALKSASSAIKSYGKHTAPENGLVLCAGNASANYCS